MRFRTGTFIALVCALCSAQTLAEDEAGADIPDDWPTPGSSNIAPKYKATLEKPANVEWSLWAELGFLAVASHIIQLSNDGTRFDYRNDGGQDVLFPFFRLSTDLKFKGRHTVVFLYQPLKLTGETVLSQDTCDFTDRVAGFFNLRYLGGGAVGTESNPNPPSDGYTKNWLHFITVSLGVEFQAVGC